ncbi:MAG: hypothetical protein ACRCT2_01985, partial [Plesiomonas shigelloides]
MAIIGRKVNIAATAFLRIMRDNLSVSWSGSLRMRHANVTLRRHAAHFAAVRGFLIRSEGPVQALSLLQ